MINNFKNIKFKKIKSNRKYDNAIFEFDFEGNFNPNITNTKDATVAFKKILKNLNWRDKINIEDFWYKQLKNNNLELELIRSFTDLKFKVLNISNDNKWKVQVSIKFRVNQKSKDVEKKRKINKEKFKKQLKKDAELLIKKYFLKESSDRVYIPNEFIKIIKKNIDIKSFIKEFKRIANEFLTTIYKDKTPNIFNVKQQYNNKINSLLKKHTKLKNKYKSKLEKLLSTKITIHNAFNEIVNNFELFYNNQTNYNLFLNYYIESTYIIFYSIFNRKFLKETKTMKLTKKELTGIIREVVQKYLNESKYNSIQDFESDIEFKLNKANISYDKKEYGNGIDYFIFRNKYGLSKDGINISWHDIYKINPLVKFDINRNGNKQKTYKILKKLHKILKIDNYFDVNNKKYIKYFELDK